MARVKAWYGDWQETTTEEALTFAKFLYQNITCIPDSGERVRYIIHNHVRGIMLNERILDNGCDIRA